MATFGDRQLAFLIHILLISTLKLRILSKAIQPVIGRSETLVYSLVFSFLSAQPPLDRTHSISYLRQIKPHVNGTNVLLLFFSDWVQCPENFLLIW